VANTEGGWLDYRLHTGKRLGDATKADLEAEARWCFEQADKDFALAEELKKRRAGRAPAEKRARRSKRNTKSGE
jgi:hypothetical protein